MWFQNRRMKSRKSMRSSLSQHEKDDIELETTSAEMTCEAGAAIDSLRADEPVNHEL